MGKSYKAHSRVDWETEQTGWPGLDKINAGSLQRIADAVEFMSQDYVNMKMSRDSYKRTLDDYRETIAALNRSISAYKAHITRLKRKLKNV